MEEGGIREEGRRREEEKWGREKEEVEESS